jgi:hypothetical protein
MIADIGFEAARRLLWREYPSLTRGEIERYARHCRGDKWFLALLKKQPRSVGLAQAKDDLNVEEIAEAEGMPRQTVTDSLAEFGNVAKLGKSDQAAAEHAAADNHEIEIKALEASAKLLLGSNPSRVQRMTASVMLGLLRGDYDAKAIEKHFRCSDETVRRITKRVKEYRSED